MRQAAAREDGDAARPCALGELVAEPALPDPGLAHDRDGPALPGRVEHHHLALAADERGEAASGVQRRETGRDRARALQRVEQNPLAHALQREDTEILEREEAADEARGVVRQVDRVGGRDLLDPLGEPDGVSDRGVLPPHVVPDRADDRLARVEPHANRKIEAALTAERLRVAAELVAQVEGRGAGALRVVLVRDRRAEDRHHAVAGVLDDRPAEAMHAVREEREEKRSISARQSSTSICSASAIDPRTSAKSTVTCFRSLAASIVIVLRTADHRADVNACRIATSRTKVGGAFLQHALTPSPPDAYGVASTHAARMRRARCQGGRLTR